MFSPRGDYLYVATRGPQTVERLDVFSGDNSGNLFTVGYAPEGLALSADGRYLFVDAYLSRELVVYDTSVFDTPGPDRFLMCVEPPGTAGCTELPIKKRR